MTLYAFFNTLFHVVPSDDFFALFEKDNINRDEDSLLGIVGTHCHTHFAYFS